MEDPLQNFPYEAHAGKISILLLTLRNDASLTKLSQLPINIKAWNCVKIASYFLPEYL